MMSPNDNQPHFVKGHLLSPLFSHGDPCYTTSTSLVDFSCRCTWSGMSVRDESVRFSDTLSVKCQDNHVDSHSCRSDFGQSENISSFVPRKPKQFSPVILQHCDPKTAHGCRFIVPSERHGIKSLNMCYPFWESRFKNDFLHSASALFFVENSLYRQHDLGSSSCEDMLTPIAGNQLKCGEGGQQSIKMSSKDLSSSCEEIVSPFARNQLKRIKGYHQSIKMSSKNTSENFHGKDDCNRSCNIRTPSCEIEENVKTVKRRKTTRTEKTPMSHKCPFCPTSCSNRGQLKGHVRVHTGEKPFQCTCGKSFARNEELTRHARIHTGVKPFSCDLCTKRFGRKDHLNKHRVTHKKKAPGSRYGCTQCW